ncbi:MAG: type II toxin-antitoxin system HicB family antitoxin [Magnetococcales bacterium]|nr:type II toxin-antitoxin system HicB family antitoxin [Magnetococcales bacterium]
MDIRYPILLEPQEPKGFFVRFPDMDDTFTEGDTEKDAIRNAEEVLTAMLGWKIDNGHSIPEPSMNVIGARYVAPDAKTQAAILLRRARKAQSMAEIARSMGTSWAAVKRLENSRH